MSSKELRDDGELFADEYLSSLNPDVAESILWPVPVLHQSAADAYDTGDVSVSPGDVLECVDTSREEFLLVVAVLDEHRPAGLLCYSTNREELVDISPVQTAQGETLRGNTSADTVATQQGVYGVHHDVVDPVDDAPIASVSFVEDSPIIGDYEMSRPDAYYPYSNPPKPLSPRYPSQIFDAQQGDNSPLSEEDLRGALFTGDAQKTLSRMPTDAVHSWVTSPPYPCSQRDYDVDGQIGVESSPRKYLESLLSVIRQAMRVTRQDGVGWLVIDDAILDGEYLGIPDRLVGALREEGFQVIHNGPWVKEGTKPDPAPNRFAHDHERIIGIANADDYFFHRRATDNDSDVISEPTSARSDFQHETADIQHDAKFSVELAEQLLLSTTPEHTCPVCGAPFSPEYSVDDILDLRENRHKERVLDAFHSTPEITREHARACRAVGLSHTGQAARTEDGAGKNSSRVQELVEEVRESAFPSSYIREFSYAKKTLSGYTQCCDCAGVAGVEDSDPGLVLDPFIGSGTTGVAAMRQNRAYTGIDLNEDYIELAEHRLSKGVNSTLAQFATN
jgi:DNA modification methylase